MVNREAMVILLRHTLHSPCLPSGLRARRWKSVRGLILPQRRQRFIGGSFILGKFKGSRKRKLREASVGNHDFLIRGIPELSVRPFRQGKGKRQAWSSPSAPPALPVLPMASRLMKRTSTLLRRSAARRRLPMVKRERTAFTLLSLTS